MILRKLSSVTSICLFFLQNKALYQHGRRTHAPILHCAVFQQISPKCEFVLYTICYQSGT